MKMNTSDFLGRRRAVGRFGSSLGATLLVAVLALVGPGVSGAAPSDSEYTSPTYGYSISWDPAVWTNADEYVGSFDSLSLDSDSANFMLTGTNVFDDLSTCVSENIAGFAALGEFTTATGVTGPTPAPGAEATLTTAELLTDTGTTADAVAYFECRWVVEGDSTVAITLLTGADTFAQVLPLYEALIAGLVIPGSAPPSTGVTSTAPTGPPSTVITPGAGAIPPATQQPTGLGDDPALNTLAESCFDGDMAACDDLYGQGAAGTAYQQYGDTCAGRQPLGTGQLCANAFPAPGTTPQTTAPPGAGEVPPATQQPTGLGDDPALNALAQSCFDGDMTACDDLYTKSAADSLYEDYGDTCAGRQPLGSGRYCADAFGGAGQTTLPATATTAPIAAPPSTAVPSLPPPVTTGGGAVGPVDSTSEAAALASMLQPADVSAGATSSGIGPDDAVDLPGWTDNGGIRALSQTLSDDVIIVFDFRWQFPDAASAAAFLDAAEFDLSEVSTGSEAAAAPVTPVADTRYYTFSSDLFTPVAGFNYLMRHENIVAKVYVSGSEGEVTEQDAARIAQIAGDRMIAAHSGSSSPQTTQPTTTFPAPLLSTVPAQVPTPTSG